MTLDKAETIIKNLWGQYMKASLVGVTVGMVWREKQRMGRRSYF
jgi:hypothetical protein